MHLADEANTFMNWRETDSSEPELRKLLNFFVSISKYYHLAHVILATSDYSLAAWLTESRFHCFLYFTLFLYQNSIKLILILNLWLQRDWPRTSSKYRSSGI